MKVSFLFTFNSAVVLFLVEETERNEFDQRALEYGIIKLDPTIEIIRVFWSDLKRNSYVTDDGKYFLYVE